MTGNRIPASGLATTRDVLADAERRLRNAGVPSPSFDATELLAHVSGRRRNRMIMSDPVPPEILIRFEALVVRRSGRVPLQHLTGSVGFRHLELLVGPGVFIPRPETELVTETALREVQSLTGRRRVVDLCAGSGAIGLSLAVESDDVDVLAVELDPGAVEWAERNVAKYQEEIAARGSTYELVSGDAGDPDVVRGWLGTAHVVVTNPPYIPDGAMPREPEVREHDPRMALFGGPDGLDVVRRLVGVAHSLLKPGGLLVVEHADSQGEDAGEHGVPQLLRAAGEARWFAEVADRPDLNRRPRTTSARKVRS